MCVQWMVYSGWEPGRLIGSNRREEQKPWAFADRWMLLVADAEGHSLLTTFLKENGQGKCRVDERFEGHWFGVRPAAWLCVCDLQLHSAACLVQGTWVEHWIPGVECLRDNEGGVG